MHSTCILSICDLLRIAVQRHNYTHLIVLQARVAGLLHGRHNTAAASLSSSLPLFTANSSRQSAAGAQGWPAACRKLFASRLKPDSKHSPVGAWQGLS